MFSFHWLLIVNYLLGSDLHGRLERLKTANNNKTLWLRVYYTNQQKERPILREKKINEKTWIPCSWSCWAQPEKFAQGIVLFVPSSAPPCFYLDFEVFFYFLSQEALHPVFCFDFEIFYQCLSRAGLHPNLQFAVNVFKKTSYCRALKL